MKDNIMAVGILKEQIDYGDFKKCGEITTRISLGKKEIYLNCEFCDYTYLQLNNFIHHVYEEHLSEKVELNCNGETTEFNLNLENEWEAIRTGEGNDEDIVSLRDFEKVVIELDTNEINNVLNTEEAAPEEMLRIQSPQNFEANEIVPLSNEINESNCACEIDWDITLVKNKKEEKEARKNFILEFIEVYRSLPALWNPNSKSYQDNELKNEHYGVLLKKYREKYPKSTMNVVKQKIRGLRSNYLREVKLCGSTGISTLYYYDAMSFLNDIKPHSRTQNNLHTLDEASVEEDACPPDEIYNCGGDLETADDEEDMDRIRRNEKIRKKNEISCHKKFVLEFIAVYKSLTALWNKKSADYHNIVLKNKQYKTLIAKYKEKYPEADKDSVKEKIRGLRTGFVKASKQRGPKHLYYYDAMAFLLPNNRRFESQNETDEIERKLQPSLDALTVPKSLLNDAQLIELAEIYQRYTCLWDEKDIAYRFANRRREARNNLLKEFNERSGMNLMMSDLEKELARLRKICSNEKKQKISCKRKNLTYKPTCSYYEHIAYLEVDVSPYECEVCGQIFAGVCQYKVHLSSHDGSLPFKCHICGHGFKLATNLTVHLRRHVQDYTYSCKVCNKPCATTTDLKIHLRLHTGERPYVCHICGKTFSSCSELRGHGDRVHEKRKPYKCEICSKAFFCKQTLKDHLNAHLKVRDSICNVCDKGFTSRKLLLKHKVIHDVEKKYECKFCGKRFWQSTGLNAHMKCHGTKLSAIPIKSWSQDNQ